MESLLGQRLGNYNLTRLLGSGGYADVYLGQHVHLGLMAAIKVIRVENNDAQAFMQEGQHIASLNHPNILRVLDLGIDHHLLYLVMDYAPNGTLRHRHPRGSILSVTTLLPYVQQIAAALQYAHDRRLVHRDVKPENMLIGADGNILLSDFGIATIASSTTSLTSQQIVGTASYMAPEQLQGRPRVTSDQYALGVVIYEWLCGERPFTGPAIEMAMKHLLMLPSPLREKNPHVSVAVEQVVLRALAKDPKDRFQSIRDFALALEQASVSQVSAPDVGEVLPLYIAHSAPEDLTDKKRVVEAEVALPATSQEAQEDLTYKKGMVEAAPLSAIPSPEVQEDLSEAKSSGEEAASPIVSAQEDQEKTQRVSRLPREQLPTTFFYPPYSPDEQLSASEVGSFYPPQSAGFSPGFTEDAPEEARESLLLPPEQTKAFSESVLPENTRKDFFISYTRADRGRAMWIAACLQEAGYSVLLPPVDFRMGFIFRNEIQKAFSQAQRMLVAFSPDYLAALRSRSAGFNAFKRAVMQKPEFMLSICVRDHDSLAEDLSGVDNYIDLTGENEITARSILLAYIRGEGIELPATAAAQSQVAPLSVSETQIAYAAAFGSITYAGISPATSALPALAPEPVRERAEPSAPTSSGIEVFFSYSHTDEEMRRELEKHLSNLKRQRAITGWHDGLIRAGDVWEEEIEAHLSSAQIILLLISPDFIDSDYCYKEEMLKAMKRHKAGEAHVIPIILRPAHWERAPFGKLQALPPGAKPLTLWANRDEAFVSVAKGIQKIVDDFSKSTQSSQPDAMPQVTEGDFGTK